MEVETTDDKVKDDSYYEQRLCKVINQIPEDVRDRFKLLKSIMDKKVDTVEKMRKLNLKFEQLKAPMYEIRNDIINGDSFPEDYLKDFDQKHEQLKAELGKNVDEDESAAVTVDTSD